MSRTTGSEDDADSDDWADRHARIERRRSGRPVRAEQSSDDWEARHSRTKKHNA
ncbi:hypothetical protein [Halomicrobium salinisoli]|uniref:hypothetical protein n=1 Tax=Halomicrobium salinisoli TaxID=2878391 RepID=UPI001CF08F1B|nr:hypothetical protein [Halomicrobium salinisoli]